MGIGASLTLLFVAGFFSTIFWLLARMPAADARPAAAPERQPHDSVAG